MPAPAVSPAPHPFRDITASNRYRPRSLIRGEPAVEAMADDMRVAVTRTGAVTIDDLKVIGWTALQITLYGDKARERAQRDFGAVL